MAEPGFITPAQAAAELQLSIKSIYKMCRIGKLRFVKIGRAVRIPRDELERLISTRANGQAPADDDTPYE